MLQAKTILRLIDTWGERSILKLNDTEHLISLTETERINILTQLRISGFVLVLLALAVSTSCKPAVVFKANGYYQVKQSNGVWWLVDPQGKPFYSVGVCSIQPVGDDAPKLAYAPYHRNILAKYGSDDAWARATETRLEEWGINTKAGWSSSIIRLPEFMMLNFSGSHWLKGNLPDFFSNEFIDGAENIARTATRPNDSNIIAYFLDNEMQWESDWRFGPSIFDLYMSMPSDSAGKNAIVGFFKSRYSTPDKLSKIWLPAVKSMDDLLVVTKLSPAGASDESVKADREAWTLFVARQYFKVTTTALRKHSPNHLIAGCRFVSWTTPRAVVQACGEFCDIVSINHYELGPIGKVAYDSKKNSVRMLQVDMKFKDFYRAAKKPLLITEFGFRANDSGLPNSFPPPLLVQPTVSTQKAKGDRYREWVTDWAACSYFVGHHWFKYMDEPKEGRFDGENGNYGLVNIEDIPYTDFVSRLTSTNRSLKKVHAESASILAVH